jgi:peptidoglycan-associated lipoprotein
MTFFNRPMTLSAQLRKATFLLAALLVVAASGCKPHYPHCKNDAQCMEHGEVCVNGQCQECKDASTCLQKYPNEIRACVEGRCEMPPECHVTADCLVRGADLMCRNNRCVPQCESDAECGASQACVSHKCVTACKSDAGCPVGNVCVDGHCETEAEALRDGHHSCRPTKVGDVVALDTVVFAFNQYDLSAETRATLEQAALCLKQGPSSLRVVLEGHCDDRGTQEYNLALGERRSQAVEKYLRTLGIDASRLDVVSKGENEPVCTEANESCYARNRRVEFVQRPGIGS